jgi:hypothetical protein
MRQFTYISTTTNRAHTLAHNLSEILFLKKTKAKTPQWALAWTLFLSFALLAMSTNLYAQTVDTDGDGIADSIDLDDDNDGILDTDESSCQYGLAVNKAGVLVSKPATINYTFNNNTLSNLVDNVDANVYVIAGPTGTLSNSPWLNFEFPTAKILTFLEIGHYSGQTLFSTTSTYKIQGSTDNATWVDVTGTLTYNNVTPSTKYGFSTYNSNIANFPLNTNAYKYYRIYGLTASSVGGAATEIYFKEKICTDIDTDNDGIPNRLDLDSDGDGCSDAIEGGAAFTAANTTATGALSGSVSSAAATLGVPTIAGTGQAYGHSQSGVINACTDTDTDGIPDVDDLDDDNDGILDTEESLNSCGGSLITPTAAIANSIYSGTPASHTIDGSAFSGNGNGLFATVSSPGVLADNWLMAESQTTGFLEYTLPSGSSVGGVALWAPDLANYGVGDAPLKDFTVTVTYDGGKTYTSPMFTTLMPTGSGSLTQAQVFDLKKTFQNTTSIRLNITAGWYDVNDNNTSYVSTSSGVDIHPGYNMSLAEFRAICGIIDIDTDNDGIPNRLDLDSDGDGCPDAIEGGAAFTPASTTGTGALSGSVSSAAATLGVPTIAGTGQANGNSQNGAVNGCTDTDTDGIPDVDDLDDDNDGILDAVESNCQFGVVVNKAGVLVSRPASISYTFNNNTLSNLVDNVDANVYVISGATGTLSNNAWLNFEFPTSKVLTYLEIGHYVNQTLFSTTSTYKIQGSIDNATWVDVTGTLTYNNVATNVSGGLSSNNSNITNFPSNTNAYKYYRIYGLTASSVGGAATEIYFKETICTDIDTDSDGIPNRLDLDSDGDGCSDAIEGAAAFTAANLSATGALSGSVSTATATLGVPTLAGTGQSMGYSQNGSINACTDTDTDGIPNVDDLDDDNDGILDAEEAPSCYFTATEANEIASISTSLTISTGSTPLLYNGVLTTATPNFAFTAAQALANANIFTVTYPTPVNLNSMTVVNTTSLGTSSTAKLQGSEDGFTWVDLTSAAVSMSTTANKVFTVNQNAAEYQYYRIFGVATATSLANPIFEITSILNTAYNPSAHPKATCTVDSDNDGISNNLDLDSDGDGCSDAIEGGAAFRAANTTTAGGFKCSRYFGCTNACRYGSKHWQ